MCDKLDKINRNFPLGSTEEKIKLHLVKWDNVIKKKSNGGPNIRSARNANVASLAKAGCKILLGNKSLWSQTFEATYLKYIMNCVRIMLLTHGKVFSRVREGLGWRVGEGTKSLSGLIPGGMKILSA